VVAVYRLAGGRLGLMPVTGDEATEIYEMAGQARW
jgi:hypothetical protein